MSALDRARQKWKLDAAKAAELNGNGTEEKAKKPKKPSKPRAGAVQKPSGKTAVKAEPITDMKAHLRTHTIVKDSSIPLQKQIKDSLDALQKAQEALSAEQLEEKTGHACGPGSALADQLRKNPKVVMDAGLYKYKAASDVAVHDRAGALKFIENSHGCILRDLTATYGQAEKDVEKMRKEGLIWVLPATEKGQVMLYPRKHPPLLTVNEAIRKDWLAIQVPEDTEEEAKELKRAGITSAVQKSNRERPRTSKRDREKKKRAPNFSRFTKITNSHMMHLFEGEAGTID